MQSQMLPFERLSERILNQLFLASGEYRTCHICLPDMQQRLPAIVVEEQYYSYFKTVKDRDKALKVVAKLFENKDDALITQTPKGYNIWVLEPTAYLSKLNSK